MSSNKVNKKNLSNMRVPSENDKKSDRYSRNNTIRTREIESFGKTGMKIPLSQMSMKNKSPESKATTYREIDLKPMEHKVLFKSVENQSFDMRTKYQNIGVKSQMAKNIINDKMK